MWKYILLGAVQGVVEWIPISSEGVLVVLGRYLIEGVNLVDLALFLHLGTLLAVLVYFWRDWVEIFTLRNPRLLKFLFTTTILTGIVGYSLYRLARNNFLGNYLLIITGIGLLFTAYFQQNRRTKKWNLNRIAWLSGILQGMAVIPGFSRSGATFFGLSFGELKSSQILKLSYLMSVPVVLMGSVFLLLKQPSLIREGWIATIVSFGVGLISLRLLFRLSERVNFFWVAISFSLLCFAGAIINFCFI